MKNTWRVVAILVVLSILLAACAPAVAPSPAAAPAAPQAATPAAPAAEQPTAASAAAQPQAPAGGSTTLRFFHWYGADDQAKVDAIVKKFEAEHTGVTVKTESVAGSGAAVYPDVLRTSIAAGDPPDVFFMWGGTQAAQFILAKQTLPLEEYYAQYKWNDRFPSWIIDRLKVNGKIYGVPFTLQGMTFFYKKDTLKKVGIESRDQMPKTFADFEGLCGKLKEKNIYCITMGGKYGWHVMRVVDYIVESKCGPQIHNGLNALKESWDQKCVVDSYATLQQWIKNGWVVPDFLTITPEDARLPLYKGDAAFVLEGTWEENTLLNDGMDPAQFDFFIHPTDQDPLRVSAFPEQLMIPYNAKNPKLAAEFIDFWTSEKLIAESPEASQLLSRVSPNKNVQPDCAKYALTCAFKSAFLSLKDTFPPTDQAFYKELMDSFFEVQDKVINQSTTPADAAKLMQQRAADWKSKNADKLLQ